jgi:uncharacterized protein (DUF1330 family)
LTLLVGIYIGAAAVQGLHAQMKPPAYAVIAILKINDAATFTAGVVDRPNAAADLKAAGGEWLIRSTKFTKLDGNPPERLIVLKFDSVEKAQAFQNTPAQKEVKAIREKTTDSVSFIVEGYAN